MQRSKMFFIVMLLFGILHGSLAMANNISITNNTHITITKLECFSEHATTPDSLALENLSANSTAHVPFSKFPDQLCSRLVFTMADGQKWQFYTEHEVGSLENFSLELSPIARHSKHTVPLYTAKNADYYEQKAAGLPLFLMAQLLADSTLESLKAWITPGTTIGVDNNAALAFAGLSWNVMKNSLEVKDNKLQSIRFEVPFMLAPAHIANLAEDMRQAGLELRELMVDGQTKKLKGSDAIDNAFTQCMDAKNCQMLFQNTSIQARLSLLDGQSMQLRLSKAK